MWILRNLLSKPEDGGEGGSGGGAPAPAPAAAPTPAASPAPEASATTASPAPAPSKSAAPAAPAAEDGKANENNEGYWPADWRKTVSKDDAKVLARLERYASPEAAMQALVAAQNRIAAGELKPVLGKNPTAEQVAEYREALGIPDTPAKYDLGKLAEGLSGDGLAELLKEAHDTHQTPQQVQATLRAYKTLLTKAEETRLENDNVHREAAEEELRKEWGPEFKLNMSKMHNMLDFAGSQSAKDALLNGRLQDGTRIGDSPLVMRLLASLANIHNPTDVLVPGSDGNQVQGIEARITEMENMMKTDRKKYNDPKISGPDGEYVKLIAARERMKPRSAAS
jgi:hypothetical protein